jgi:hypothetical protein
MVDVTLPVGLKALDIVRGAPEYVVAVPFVVTSMLDFVLCCRRDEVLSPACAFLSATVLGLDITETANEISD